VLQSPMGLKGIHPSTYTTVPAFNRLSQLLHPRTPRRHPRRNNSPLPAWPPAGVGYMGPWWLDVASGARRGHDAAYRAAFAFCREGEIAP